MGSRPAVKRLRYCDRKLNMIVAVGSVVAVAVFWVLLRQQVAVSDRSS
jgi:hypothetical protein